MDDLAGADLDARLKDYSRYTEVRQLAFAVAAEQQARRFRSLAVLSFSQAEGRTTFCAVLAMAYAELCRTRALVLDTTQRHSPGSVMLQERFSAFGCPVDILSPANLGGQAAPLPWEAALPRDSARSAAALVLSPACAAADGARDQLCAALPPARDEYSMIRRVLQEGPRRYGLIVLDTMPLDSRNKGNVDPRLVARLAGASVLVVSRRLLDSPGLEERLRTLEDPSLRLIGLVANEEAGL